MATSSVASFYSEGWENPFFLTGFILNAITVGVFVYCFVASFRSRWRHDGQPDRLRILLYRISLGAALIYLILVLSADGVINVDLNYHLSIYILFIFTDLASRVSEFFLFAVTLRSCHEDLYSHQKSMERRLTWRKMSIYGLIAVLIATVASWCFGVNYYVTIMRQGSGATSTEETAAEETAEENTEIHWLRIWTIVDIVALSFYFLLTVPICRATTKPSNRSHMDRPSRRYWAFLGISLTLRYLVHIPLEGAAELTSTYDSGVVVAGLADQLISAILSPMPYFALARLGRRGVPYAAGIGADGLSQPMLSTPYTDLPPLTGMEKYNVVNLRKQSSAGRGLSPTTSRESGISIKRKPVPPGSWQDEPYTDPGSSFTDLGLARPHSRTLDLPDPNYHARPGYLSRQTDELLP